jgi:hypothetical protein
VPGFEVVDVDVVFVVCSDVAGLVSVSAIVVEASKPVRLMNRLEGTEA